MAGLVLSTALAITGGVQNGLNQTLADAYKSQQVYKADGTTVPMHSNVTQAEAEALYHMVLTLRPACSLEVGLAQGCSTLAILQGLHENGVGHHHVMDPFQNSFGDCGLAMVARAGYASRLAFYPKFAEEVIPALPEVGFAFIDASHLFDLTLVEFVLTDKKLAVGGVVALHDSHMASLRALIRYVLTNRAYEIVRATAPLPLSRRGSALKRTLGRVCRHLPLADHIFAQSFLHPWDDYALPNLVFLRKKAHDSRNWTDHQPF